MKDEPEVIPQPGDRWLLRDGGRCYVLPAELGRRLRAGEIVPGLVEALAELRTRPPAFGGRTLRLKLPLLPGAAVARAARLLAPAVSWPIMAAASGAGGLLYLAAILGGGSSLAGFSWPVLIALLLSAGFVHELGHAAALSRAGGRPGPIGIGVLFVLPALYCDVTAVTLLPRSERLRVDTAGIVWHLPCGGALALAGVIGDWPAAMLASWGVLGAVIWSLLPFLRTDGYWLLCDALGLNSLEDPAPAGSSRQLRVLLVVWRLAHAAFLGLLGYTFASRAASLEAVTVGWPPSVRVIALVAAAVLVSWMLWGMWCRTAALLRGAVADVRPMR